MLNHKEAFKQAAANWELCKSAKLDPPDEASAVLGCQRVPKAVADSPMDSDSSDEMEKENCRVQRQAQGPHKIGSTPYNAFMNRGIMQPSTVFLRQVVLTILFQSWPGSKRPTHSLIIRKLSSRLSPTTKQPSKLIPSPQSLCRTERTR